MKYKRILLLVLIVFCTLRCSKVFVITNHERPYDRILEDLKIPQYDSSTTLVEFRLWIHSAFGFKNLYRFQLSKDSIWTGEKFTPYLYGRRGPVFLTNSFISKNRNKLLWTKKEKVLNKKWKTKWEKLKELSINNLSGIDNYSHVVFYKDSVVDSIVIVDDGETFEIEIFENKYYKMYSYFCPSTFIKYNKNNVELQNIVEIINIITKEI